MGRQGLAVAVTVCLLLLALCAVVVKVRHKEPYEIPPSVTVPSIEPPLGGITTTTIDSRSRNSSGIGI